ncbi:MAG: amidohydrolase [Bacillota bacterium]|jgi:amidohydrolase|nr:amidohydrolase [Bacillota bacterium]
MKSRNFELAKQLRHELHEHPELSNEEVWSKAHLIEFLKKHTKLEIVDKGLWFYAIYKAGENKKNIAFRADFDALPFNEITDLPYKSKFPGVAHQCGHDGHAAGLCGLALEVDQNGADKNVYFLFQHAEEIGDGAVYCQSFIKECNIEEIYAFHSMSGFEYNSVNIIDGTSNCSSKGMTIKLEGSPAHASQPETGKNPSFAIAEIVRAIPDFISPEKNEGIILSTVVNINVGKKAFGMSASKGEVSMTIRALYEKEMDALQKNLEDIAKSEAEKYGLKVSFEYQDYFPETSNHKETNDNIRKVCKEKGILLNEFTEAFRGSEDFGYYTKLTKGSICYIGNGIDYPHVHTNEFDFRDELIETPVELFKGLIEL